MRTPWIAFALLLWSLLPAAAQDSAFTLSGDLTASMTLAADEALYGGIGFEPVTASSALHAVLSFARSYRALGLLDFTFADSDLLAHADGAMLETLSFDVNQFYADLNYADLIYLRAGKQRLKWGAGWVFNPSDPVNPPKDPTAARQTTEGVPAFKAELITTLISFAAFTVAYDRLANFGVGGKVSSSALPGSDLSLSAYWSQTDSWTAALNLSVAPLYALPGWDTVQLWLEGCLYGEPRYLEVPPAASPSGLQHSLLAGVSATLPGIRTSILAEYYRLSEGLTLAEEQLVSDTKGSKALAVRPGRLGKDYAFLSLTQGSITDNGHPLLDHVGLSSSLLLNITDLSMLARHGISTAFIGDSAVDLSVAWAAGGESSEFGNLVSAVSVELELKVFY
jgi:hypothetical protein